jgi:hypothetical protein
MAGETITLARRFHGPPASGNGGYTCGRLAAHVPGPATVRLLSPPPLEKALRVERQGEVVRLLDGDTAIAEGRSWSGEVEPPDPAGFEEAVRVSRTYEGFTHHWFPSCFVCGPERAAGEGLRLFPGRLPDGKHYAAPWIPDATLAGEDGRVRPEFVWAALDCPGAHSFAYRRENAVVLGELSVRLLAPVHGGERCVVMGWEERHQGRKHFTGTALFGEDGGLRAVGRAIWFEVPAADFAKMA